MESIEKVYQKAAKLKKQSHRLLLFAALTAAMGTQLASAQTFSEWFRQKSTQKKYLLEQLSALLAYRQSALNGYNIAKGGLGSIGGYLCREFGLHDSYYLRFKTVSAPVKSDPQAKTILRRQADILALCRQAEKQEGLAQAERSYTKSVCTALLKDCDGQLHDLETLLADTKTSMSDEQRLRHLARIANNMQENYRFMAAFSSQLKVYVLQKEQATRNVNQTRQLYGKAN